MDLSEYLAVLRKRWFVIVLMALIGGGAGYASTAQDTPLYSSSATVLLTPTRGDTISELNQGASYTSNLIQTYVLLARKPVVLEPVIQTLDLGVSAKTLARSIQADTPLNSYFIDISASNADPQQAAVIANAVAAQMSRTVATLPPTAEDGSSALTMTQVAQATPALAPFSPRPRTTAAAGLAAGIALGVIFALLRAQLDTRIRTVKDLPQSPVRTALGQIPQEPALAKQPRTVIDRPHEALAESYRRLRANLQFLDASRPLQMFVVTSSLPGEGKSTTAVHLALAMAEKGSSVLLVDADLRAPTVASICGLEGSAGLSAVLIHEATLDDVAQPWQTPGLHVIAAGQIPPNPSQLIESKAMDEFLRAAHERYDLVILDTAPLLAVTDGAVLARRTDGALVVARSRKVRRADLAEALAGLDAVGAHVLGVLVNGVKSSRADRRYGYGQAAAHRKKGPFRRVKAWRAARRARHLPAFARSSRPMLPASRPGLFPPEPTAERQPDPTVEASGPGNDGNTSAEGGSGGAALDTEAATTESVETTGTPEDPAAEPDIETHGTGTDTDEHDRTGDGTSLAGAGTSHASEG